MREKLIKLLEKNARTPDKDLAAMLGVSEKEVANEIKTLEKEGIIRGYALIVERKKMLQNPVTAVLEIKVTPKAKSGYASLAELFRGFSEVESVRLMSGKYDFLVTVKCDTLDGVGYFVADKLSPIDGVLDIATHFVIGRYKERGINLGTDTDGRSWVSP